MKKVVRCLGCDGITRYYGSYRVSLLERVKSVLTGRIQEHKVEGHLCRKCAKKAGYKIR